MSLWKVGPWSVWMTSGVPNRQMWFRMAEAVSIVVVDLVGNSSIHLEKASMMTSMYSLPCASFVKGPMWSKWRTSNGLYEAQVNRWVLICTLILFITWHAGHWRMNSLIIRSVIPRSPRRRQMSNPQWPTRELWIFLNLAETSSGSTIIGTSATILCSASVGSGGMLFAHNLDKVVRTGVLPCLGHGIDRSFCLGWIVYIARSCRWMSHWCMWYSYTGTKNDKKWQKRSLFLSFTTVQQCFC